MTKEELTKACKEWSDESPDRHLLLIAVETHGENDDVCIMTSCNAMRIAANICRALQSDDPPKGLEAILRMYNAMSGVMSKESPVKPEENKKVVS